MDPRIEFRLSPEARRRLVCLSQEVSHQAGKYVPVSQVVKAVIEDFLVRVEAERAVDSESPLAFVLRESKKKT
jgi:predicted DNA-binding protein